MKPARFSYASPHSLEEALELLAASDDAAVIAGGQSLVPELAFRDRSPTQLVDVNALESLGEIAATDGGVRIGALVRHDELATSSVVRERCPPLPAAARLIAHPPIRNRGTFGGSIAYGHPAAELGAVVAAAGGEVELASLHGQRTLPFTDFARGPFDTARRPDELLTSVTLPSLEGMRQGVHEITRRTREFAQAGAVVALRVEGGSIVRAHVALFGVEGAQRRLVTVEDALLGQGPEGVDEVASADIAAADAYRRHLAGVAVKRAVDEAIGG